MNDPDPTTDRYQRGLERMMELVSPEHAGSYDHAKLVDSYRALDEHLADYIVSFAFGDIYSRDSLTQQEQTLVTISMLTAGVTEAGANFAALVVGNDGVNFSAGANLMLLLLEAQEGNWDEVDMVVRAFQGATTGLKYADVPVVVAPAGLTLGGGCEITLHGDRVQAAAETYIGLVEVGVGLIPAGGGTKEMLARAAEAAPAGGDLLPSVQRVFETIGFGKVATSGPDAKRIGYLRDADEVTMNRDRLIADAKAAALARVPGYVRKQPRSAIRVGGEPILAALKLGVHLALRAGRISEHDAVIGRKLGWILAGGDMPHAGTLTEQQMLDLEREAFLSLLGERKTQERIAYTLKTGKPLRN